MRRTSYGYGSYRGRGRGSPGLKVIAVLLALVLVLAVALFFLAGQYLVYGDDGTVRLELPFLRQEEPAQETPDPTPLPPVVTPEPSPETADRPETILPVALPAEALYDGTAAEGVAQGGGTAALFDMKTESGMLAWVSGQELAIAAKVSAGDPTVNEAMKTAAAEDGVYRIARISCFKDHELSNADLSLAMTTESGVRWLDADKNRWLSPASEKARSYLTALCGELAELGFDEILLDHAGYPTRGKLSYLKKDAGYDSSRLEEVVTGFYRELADSLKETGVRLSVVYDGETAALSGQSEEAIRALGLDIVLRDEAGTLTWQ